jgi:hypothetical protein
MFLPSVETGKTLIPVSNSYADMNIPTQHWLKPFKKNLFSQVPTILKFDKTFNYGWIIL